MKRLNVKSAIMSIDMHPAQGCLFLIQKVGVIYTRIDASESDSKGS
jgi:hypothetical protein